MNLHFILLLTTLGAAAAGGAEPASSLAKPLEPLRPFIGKTWKGPFKSASATSDTPRYDVARWERALNGQAVRILHSVGDGAYGGETLITWNHDTKELQFDYFTTAGFTTHGTLAFEGAKIITTEKVTGNQNGITEVKATTELLPDGRMHTKSRYLKQGEWVDGHEVTYTETPGAEVVFR